MKPDNLKKTRSGVELPTSLLEPDFENDRYLYRDLVKLQKSKLGIGIWIISEAKSGPKISIYRDGILKGLSDFGFYTLVDQPEVTFVKEEEWFIEKVTAERIGKFVFDLINESGDLSTGSFFNTEYSFKVEFLRETWLRQFESSIKSSVLSYLAPYPKPILKDSATEKFIPFENALVKISADGVVMEPYNKNIEYGIWRSQLVKNKIKIVPEDDVSCMIQEFFWNVAGEKFVRFNSFRSAIGYLCHNHQSNTQNQAVICVDEALTTLDKPEGGTGKGIFVQAIKQICKVSTVDGKAFISNNRFAFQEVDIDTQIVAIEDIKKKFDFDRLNSVLTEGLSIEKKNQDAFKFSKESSPKLVITSNVMVDSVGNTRKRRQFIIEFGDFLKRVPKDHVGDPINYLFNCKGFFSDHWDDEEWTNFYNFMFYSIKLYLEKGLVAYEHVNLKSNQLAQGTCQEFSEWIKNRPIAVDKDYDTKELYNSFRDMYGIDESEVKQRKFSSWISQYADLNELKYSNKPSNGKTSFRLTKQ